MMLYKTLKTIYEFIWSLAEKALYKKLTPAHGEKSLCLIPTKHERRDQIALSRI
jgi:hypothetical protein